MNPNECDRSGWAIPFGNLLVSRNVHPDRPPKDFLRYTYSPTFCVVRELQPLERKHANGFLTMSKTPLSRVWIALSTTRRPRHHACRRCITRNKHEGIAPDTIPHVWVGAPDQHHWRWQPANLLLHDDRTHTALTPHSPQTTHQPPRTIAPRSLHTRPTLTPHSFPS